MGVPVMPAFVLLAIFVQTATPSGTGGHIPPPPAGATKATAVRAAAPVVIDGRDDDAVWRGAPPITQFPQFQPKGGGGPPFPPPAQGPHHDPQPSRVNRDFHPPPDR